MKEDKRARLIRAAHEFMDACDFKDVPVPCRALARNGLLKPGTYRVRMELVAKDNLLIAHEVVDLRMEIIQSEAHNRVSILPEPPGLSLPSH